MYGAEFAYVLPKVETELIITFDGTRYVCQYINAGGMPAYGGLDPNTQSVDFTNYPFVVAFTSSGTRLITNTDGTHTVAASVSEIAVETTECFKAAVNSLVSPLVVHLSDGYLDKTWREISNALMGRGAVIATQINAAGDYEVLPILSAYEESGIYKVSFYSGDPMHNYTAYSPDGYPSAGIS